MDNIKVKKMLRWARKHCTCQGVAIRAAFDSQEGGYRLEMVQGNRSWAYCFGIVPPREFLVKIHVQDACTGLFK